MKKKVSFVKLLNDWSKTGQLRSTGLCNSLSTDELKVFDKFYPTDADFLALREEGLSTIYWGSGKPTKNSWESFKASTERRMGLTPLRQTLLCFCAAINNEL